MQLGLHKKVLRRHGDRYSSFYMTINEDEIREFNEKGFARISSRLLYYIRTNNISNIKFFKVGTTNSGNRGSIKYSSIDVFGDRYDYCFDIGRKKEFVDFLVAKFFNVNKNPDMSIRKGFTRILHHHGLHWDECRCVKKV